MTSKVWRFREIVVCAWGVAALTLGLTKGVYGQSSEPRMFTEEPITEYDREHWAFQPIRRPVLPAVERTDWPQQPIDYFVLRQLERNGRQPAPPADHLTWLRRVKFNLLGLPPTPEEVAACEDGNPFQPVQLVDQMLSSHAYGERWAQHWLDLARFAETDGFEHDLVRKDAWKYRQWVIDALNKDLPYDQFIAWQLTGDLRGHDAGSVPTMFCMAGPDMPDINEQDLRRHDKLNELTSTVGAALLGLQLHCAQCHDHKFDPLSQADFYRLRGIFESAVPELKRDLPIDRLQQLPEPIAPWFYFRGDVNSPGPRLSPQPPRVVCSTEVAATFSDQTPRLAFVDWLFSDQNPLTARVIANRIWQHHFGQSLCENPSDLGVVTGGPSHPDLLDWLAAELRSNGWSIKSLHRTILLSATYQQASRLREGDSAERHKWDAALAADPSNELYGRFNRVRLEGEVIRDALLAVSGRLNREAGGRSVLPELPPELLSTILKNQWPASSEESDHFRRSIYVFARRNLRYPIFDVFDRPDAGTTCARRDQSTTAIQSLHMLNSELAFQSAVGLRDRVWRECSRTDRSPTVEALIQRLFVVTLSRRPAPDEIELFATSLSATPNIHSNLLTACVALLNCNEFVYID